MIRKAKVFKPYIGWICIIWPPLAAGEAREGIIFTWVHCYSGWLLLTRIGRKWTLGRQPLGDCKCSKKERKEGRVNSSDPFQPYRALIKECSSCSLLRRSVPNSINTIFFHKWAFLWTSTCWGHFCFYWQTYSRGMKVHHGADVYLSTTGGISRGPMERECFKRGRQTFSLGRSGRSLWKNVSGASLLRPGTGSGLGARLASSRCPWSWAWSTCSMRPASTRPTVLPS